MSDEQVLNMPVRRFWLMHNNINRISAERDMRSLTLGVISSRGDKDQVEDHRKNLVHEVGHVASVRERLDREGMNRLKALAG